MFDDLKSYPRYKGTDFPWIEKIPEHWSIARTKNFLQPIDVRSQTGKEELMTVSSANGVVPRKHASVTMFRAKSYAGHKLCWPGDLVINCLWAWAGGLGVSRHHGIVSTAYGVYRIRDASILHPEYLHYLVRSSAFHRELYIRSKGVWISRLQLTDASFFDCSLIAPPIEEQRLIVGFLNQVNTRIDRAIRTKKKILALLTEQKKAIINQAVTSGIDSDVITRDSKFPWLGRIPKRWEIRRFRTLVKRIDQGVSPQASGFLAHGNSWGVLKSGCVNHGIFREEEHKQLPSSFAIDPGIVLEIGDVLISRACGTPSLVGSVGRVRSLRFKLILSDKTFRPIFRPDLDIDFMVYCMNSSYYRHQVEQAISGAEGMANNLPLSSLKDFVFAIPPRDEARKITEFLNVRLKALISKIGRLEKEVELIREYRATLITNIVTGKLDVREAASNLPEVESEVESLEPDMDLEPLDELEPEDQAA